MPSLSKITNISLTVVVLIAVITAGINFIFVPQIKVYSDENRVIEEAIVTQRAELDLPIRVLNNVKMQIDKAEDTLVSESLESAFETHQMNLVTSASNLVPEFNKMSKNWNDIAKWSLWRHRKNVDNLDRQIAILIQDALEIRNISFSFSIYTMELEALNQAVEKFDQDYNQMIESHRSLSDSVVKDINFLANLIIILLLVIAIGYSYGMRYLINKEFKYVHDSFKAISDSRIQNTELPKMKPYFSEEMQMNAYIQTLYDERKLISEIREILISHYIVEDFMDALFEKIKPILDIDRIGLAFVDYEKNILVAEYGVASYEDMFLGPGFETSFDETRLSKILAHKKTMVTPDLELDFERRPKSKALELIVDEGVKSNMILPMEMNGTVFGMVFLSSKKKNHFTSKHQELAEKIINEIKGLLNRAYFTKVVFAKITGSFSELVDQKDNETGGHILRMVAYSVVIAEGIRQKKIPGYEVDRRFVLEIERNAASHDIGKVGIPDQILKKPGKLDPDEWHVMKTHAGIGADIFRDLRDGLRVFDPEFYKMAEEISRYHHERWDGSGYPEGLKGEAIPLSARIVAIADVFDALTSKRVYKEAFDLDRALNILIDSKGTHLDPVLVDVFMENLSEIERIMTQSHPDNLE